MSISFQFALLIMEAIALWHREGMSSSFGGSVRCRTFVARDEVGVMSGCGQGLEGVRGVGRLCCGVVCYFRFAELRSFVRRLSCLLFALVRGFAFYWVRFECMVVPLAKWFWRVRGMRLPS